MRRELKCQAISAHEGPLRGELGAIVQVRSWPSAAREQPVAECVRSRSRTRASTSSCLDTVDFVAKSLLHSNRKAVKHPGPGLGAGTAHEMH